MYAIIRNRPIGPSVFRMDLHAPEIAAKHRAGNFIMLRIDETGERIPMTVADKDVVRGIITLVFQAVGKTTTQLGSMREGDTLLDVVGPLGKPTHIQRYPGSVVCVAGGIGVAPIHPIAVEMKKVGNRVISIIGARKKELLVMEEEMAEAGHEILVATDDGSTGHHGFVTELLDSVIRREGAENVSHAVAIGPVPMMRSCCKVTDGYGIPTTVSLNPIMVDATGMCGACRVDVGGEMKFACVDGPEFDGHKVDFDGLAKRLRMYVEAERESMALYEAHIHHQRCWD